MNTLIKRTITGLVFAAVMIGGVYGGTMPFLLLFGVIATGCIWEFLGLTIPALSSVRKAFYTIAGLIPFLSVAFWHSGLLQPVSVKSIFLGVAILSILFFAVLLIIEVFSSQPHPFTRIAFATLGFLYIGWPFALLQLISIDREQYFPENVMGLLLLTWSNDTFAYLTGTWLGKHKLAPTISPGKTWEGTIGGGIATVGVAWLLSAMWINWTWADWIILAVIVAVFGTIGDLIESRLKRLAGVKDSGNLMPGHGGMFDRFDALIFLLPFVAAYLLIIKNLL